MKRFFALALAGLLLLACAACFGGPADPTTPLDTTPTETHSFTTETEPPATTTVVVSTVLNLSGRTMQTAELQAFFNEYQQTMLELTKPLIEQDIQFVDIDRGYSGLQFVDETFDKAIAENFKAYIAIAEAETGYSAVISVRMVDGKRVISFSFSGMDDGGGIVYMPDGYVHVKLLYSVPETGEQAQKTEAKLADNWYSYYN